MPKALRSEDIHVCPKVDPSTKIPHVGGPGGKPNPPHNSSVRINGRPALTVGDKAFCVGPIDEIIVGIDSVRIEGKPAADASAKTAHSGRFVTASGDVEIG